MSFQRDAVLGLVIGMMVGITSLVVAAILTRSSAHAIFPMTMVVSALAGSAASGSAVAILGDLLSRLERSITGFLIAISVAALVVLSGDYTNSSQVPLIIYVMTALNGLIAAQAAGSLSSRRSAARAGRTISNIQ